jgi:hypothetical protein
MVLREIMLKQSADRALHRLVTDSSDTARSEFPNNSFSVVSCR